MKSIRSPRLGTYLTLGLGAGVLGTSGGHAATIISFYGPGSRNPGSAIPTPGGIDMSFNASYSYLDLSNSSPSYFGTAFAGYFTHGTDLAVNFAGYGASYHSQLTGFKGAVVDSSQNYAAISFNGKDGVYEAVGQFYLTATNTGYLVAIARNDDGSALSISEGKAAIDAIPEPSSIALLSLGAAGILARRRRVA